MKWRIKREIRQLIKEAQNNGQTNKEIYNKLIQEYDEEETIARLVVTTVKPKDKKKHCTYIGILLGFMAVVVLFNLWIIIKSPFPLIDPDIPHSFRYLMSQIGVLLLSYIAVLNVIYQKPSTSYVLEICSSFYLITYFLFFEVLPIWNFEWNIYLIYMIIDILSLVSIILLARFFQRKIFPDYRYGRLKKNEKGEYVFS